MATLQHRSLAPLSVAALYVLLAIATAWVTADALRGPPPVSEAPSFETKLAAFLAREPLPDVAFLGSSRVFRGIDPAAFDARTAADGQRTTSFNLAMPGMHAIEVEYAARTLLPATAGRLDTLFLAPGFLTDALAKRNERSRRVIDFHDGRATRLSLSQAWQAGTSREPGSLQRHLTAWGYRRGSIGQLRERIGTLFGDPTSQAEAQRARDDRMLGPNRDGFVSLDLVFEWSPETLGERRAQLLNEPEAFDRVVERAEAMAPAPLAKVSPVLFEIVDRVAAEAAKSKTRVIFLIPPTTHWFVPQLERVLAERPQLTVFDYSDPREFPQLYERDLWFDLAHLNARGAERFSAALAERWLELARIERSDPSDSP